MADGRKSIPIHLVSAVIERDDATCQYCGKHGVRIKRYGKPSVVEIKNPLSGCPADLSLRDYYNGKDVIPFEIDHIVPVVRGGKNIINNLILSCRSCNRSKGDRNG